MARIVIIGGNARSLIANRLDLIRAWESQGHDVTALVPENDPDSNLLEGKGIKHKTFYLARSQISPMADLKTTWQLAKTLRRIGADVILTYTIKPVIYGSIAARIARVRKRYAMITGLGYLFTGSGIKPHLTQWIAKRLYKISLPLNDKIFFQNQDDMELFTVSRLIREGQGVRIHGSGVNLDQFENSAPILSPVTFLFMNRLLKAKGVVEFVEAARRIVAKYPDVRFVVMGKYEPQVPDAIKASEISKWQSEGVIEYLGFQSDVIRHLHESSVVVLPGWYREGVPRSLLEALAVGRPIITTPTPGCKETVQDGKNGFLIPPRDPEALSRAMKKFIDEPNLVSEMGVVSREIAIEKYDVRKVNEVIMEAMGMDGTLDLEGK